MQFMVRQFIFTLIAFTVSISMYSQVSNTMYFMDRLPQSNQLNPAYQPKFDLYIGLPVLSTIQINAGNNSLKVNDILFYNSSIDSLISFMHPLASKSAFINALKPQNTIYTNLQTDIISFGFRSRNDMYFSFNLALKTDFNASYPKDLVRMLLNGIDTASAFDFKQFGINSTTYAELALGVSKPWDDYLTIGAKIKFISGILDITTDNQKLALASSVDKDGNYQLNVNSNATINAYLPYFKVKNDSAWNLLIDSLKPNDNLFKNYSPFNSFGLGFDFGATYTGFDQFIVSASLLDVGFIRWSNSVYNFKMNGNFTFSGIKNIDFLHGDSLTKLTQKIIDSISNAFKFKQQNSSYTNSLPTKLLLAGEYFPEKFFSVGLLSITQYYRSQFYEQITLSGNFRPLNMLMLSTSYSIFNNGFSNIGLGLSLRGGPLNFYIISDNIPVKFGNISMPIPYEAMGINIRFGINLIFGVDKKFKDKPYIWE